MQVKAKVPGRILVIDDEKSARTLLERVLGGAGHTVSLVETGEEGLEKLQSGTFDLMIIDKNLAGMDGLELLRLARTKFPRMQAILITGFPTEETKQAALQLGVHSYVTKPFGILDILGACDSAIGANRGTG